MCLRETKGVGDRSMRSLIAEMFAMGKKIKSGSRIKEKETKAHHIRAKTYHCLGLLRSEECP